MHPYLASARAADLQHRAARDWAARAASRARRAQRPHRARRAPGRAVTGLARRVLTLLGAHRTTPAR